MKYLKAFIAGLAFPATFLPVIYVALHLCEHSAVRELPLQFLPLCVPVVFGLWNIGYFVIGKSCPVKDRNSRLFVTGASLGLVLALFGVFVIGLPQLLLGFTGNLQYIPLLVVPIIYGLIWRYIVKPLNNLLGVEDW